MWWAAFFVTGMYIGPVGSEIFYCLLSFICACVCFFQGVPEGYIARLNPQQARILAPVLRAVLVSATGILMMTSTGLSASIYAAADHAPGADQAESEAVTCISGWIVKSIEGGAISSRSRSILKALILGRKDIVVRQLKELYAYMGAAHFLALSGLHLGMIALPVSFIISGICRKKSAADMILLSVLIIYTLVAGSPPSLLRAVMLYIAYKMFRLAGIKVSLFTALVTGCLVLLSFRFGLAYDTGFRLSFLAVGAIALLAVPVLSRLERNESWGSVWRPIRAAAASCIVTLSVQIVSLPLVLHLFGRAPVFAVVSNLVLLIPVMLMLSAGFLFVLIPVFYIRACLAPLLDLVSRIMWRLPELSFPIMRPAICNGDIDPIPYGAFLVLLFIAVKKRCYRRKRILFASIACLAAAVISGSSRKEGAGKCLQTVPMESISIAAETATALEGLILNGNRWGDSFIIDDNIDALIVQGRLTRYQAGRIAGDLWRSGKRGIDMIIAARPDPGIISGLEFLTMALGPEKVIISPYFYRQLQVSPGYDDLKDVLETEIGKNVPIDTGRAEIIVSFPSYPPGRGKIIKETDTCLCVSIEDGT